MRHYKANPGAVLLFTGDDNEAFLQGQGTADLRGDAGTCRYSLWLDFKGNIIGDGHVLKLDDSNILMISDLVEATVLMEKFERHIIADDVEIKDLTGEYEIYYLSRDPGEESSESSLFDKPAEGCFSTTETGYCYSGRRLGPGTLQLLVQRESGFHGPGASINRDQAEQMRIHASIPLIPADTDDNTLNPLEANITSPLSMTKGCYLGQEVVSRVHRLGRVSRRLVRLHSETFLDRGTELHLDGKTVGKITSVVENSDKLTAIGWLKSKIDDGNIRVDEGNFDVVTIPSS